MDDQNQPQPTQNWLHEEMNMGAMDEENQPQSTPTKEKKAKKIYGLYSFFAASIVPFLGLPACVFTLCATNPDLWTTNPDLWTTDTDLWSELIAVGFVAACAVAIIAAFLSAGIAGIASIRNIKAFPHRFFRCYFAGVMILSVLAILCLFAINCFLAAFPGFELP